MFLSSTGIFQIELVRKKYFRNTVRVLNGLDFIVCPDLGPNCLLRLSAD